MLARQDAAELLEAGRWIIERPDDCLAIADREPYLLLTLCIGEEKKRGCFAGAGVCEAVSEFENQLAADFEAGKLHDVASVVARAPRWAPGGGRFTCNSGRYRLGLAAGGVSSLAVCCSCERGGPASLWLASAPLALYGGGPRSRRLPASAELRALRGQRLPEPLQRLGTVFVEDAEDDVRFVLWKRQGGELHLRGEADVDSERRVAGVVQSPRELGDGAGWQWNSREMHTHQVPASTGGKPGVGTP